MWHTSESTFWWNVSWICKHFVPCRAFDWRNVLTQKDSVRSFYSHGSTCHKSSQQGRSWIWCSKENPCGRETATFERSEGSFGRCLHRRWDGTELCIHWFGEQHGNNCVLWIPPSKCGKRESEIQMNSKEKPQTLVLENQTVKVAAPSVDQNIDTTSDMTLQWCFQRRGIAFDQSRLINVHTSNMHAAVVDHSS